MAAEVFISYRNEDQEAANRLCEALESKGLSCWMAPRNIPAGREWPEAIVEGATNCRALVVVLSSHSAASRQVGRELETADHAGARIFTFRIENVQPPPSLAYFLSNVQWVDAFDGRFDPAVDQLVAAVNAIECPPGTERPAVPPVITAPAPAGPLITSPANKKGPNVALIGGAAALAVVAVIGVIMIARSGTTKAEQASPSQAADAAAAETTDNDEPPMTGTAEALESFRKGKALLKQGDAKGAVPLFDRTIQMDPGSPNAYAFRAAAEESLGGPKEALADANKAIQINPGWAYAYLIRGRIYARSGQYDLAISDFAFVMEHGSPANAKLARKDRAEAQRKLGAK